MSIRYLVKNLNFHSATGCMERHPDMWMDSDLSSVRWSLEGSSSIRSLVLIGWKSCDMGAKVAHHDDFYYFRKFCIDESTRPLIIAGKNSKK